MHAQWLFSLYIELLDDNLVEWSGLMVQGEAMLSKERYNTTEKIRKTLVSSLLLSSRDSNIIK